RADVEVSALDPGPEQRADAQNQRRDADGARIRAVGASETRPQAVQTGRDAELDRGGRSDERVDVDAGPQHGRIARPLPSSRSRVQVVIEGMSHTASEIRLACRSP